MYHTLVVLQGFSDAAALVLLLQTLPQSVRALLWQLSELTTVAGMVKKLSIFVSGSADGPRTAAVVPMCTRQG